MCNLLRSRQSVNAHRATQAVCGVPTRDPLSLMVERPRPSRPCAPSEPGVDDASADIRGPTCPDLRRHDCGRWALNPTKTGTWRRLRVLLTSVGTKSHNRAPAPFDTTDARRAATVGSLTGRGEDRNRPTWPIHAHRHDVAPCTICPETCPRGRMHIPLTSAQAFRASSNRPCFTRVPSVHAEVLRSRDRQAPAREPNAREPAQLRRETGHRTKRQRRRVCAGTKRPEPSTHLATQDNSRRR